MQALTLLMLLSATAFEFFSKGDHWGRWTILPSAFGYVPEVLSLFAAAYVVVAGSMSRFERVTAVYWILFGCLLLDAVLGVIANDVAAGPVFAGIRNYLRAIPWFFVPAVYAYSERQIESQLRLVLIVAVCQLPFAVQQRLTTAQTDRFTGDWTSGTLLISSVMSVFLICVSCIAAALMIRRRLSKKYLLLLLPILLLPTAINETKGTLLLLPIGFLVAFITATRPDRRMRGALVGAAVTALCIAVAVPIYDSMIVGKRYGTPIMELLLDRERLEKYLYKKEELGTDEPAGRVDSILVPLKSLSEDPVSLVFGYGMGNVSDSALGKGFVGSHFDRFEWFLRTSFSRFVLELGVLGFALVLTLMWAVYRDARVVARVGQGLVADIAGGWAGVCAVMTIAMFYKDVAMQTSLAYLFWYFSGVVVAGRFDAVAGNAGRPRK